MQPREERRLTPRIALIGATGRVGGAVARLLSSADRRFRALSRDRARARRMLGSHADAREADLRDPFSIEAALVGVERLLLVAASPELARFAIEAAERAGVARIVAISAVGSDGEVAAEHRATEAALHASSLTWTVLRPTAYMQSLAEMVELTTQGNAVRLPLGDASISWVDCRDVAAVAKHALLDEGHAGRTYVVTGPRALDATQASEVLAHALGRPLRYAPLAPESASEALCASGLPAERAGCIAARCDRLRSGALAPVTDVVFRVAHIEPRTLAHFAARHAWALEHPAAGVEARARAV